MREVTTANIAEHLIELGVEPSDGLLVHSALQFLGRPQAGVETYLQAFSQVLNIAIPSLKLNINPDLPQGTLAVPTFNFDFARGQDYDPNQTPSQGMGVFTESVRCLPEARRTPHPLQSLAVIGAQAQELACLNTAGAFDTGSAFERLLELDFSILLLGADIQSVSLLHYSEQRASVPYRFWKNFTGRVRHGQAWETRTYRMYARDMQIDARLEIHAIQDLLEARRQWRQIRLNYGWLSLCKARDFTAAADELLAQDPWIFVTNRPTWTGSVPTYT